MYTPTAVIVVALIFLVSLIVSTTCLFLEKLRLKRIIQKLEGVDETKEVNDRDWGDSEGRS